ncbi:anti-anti-sigma factor [Actinoplanes sp. TBRC 11911]|uniref:anti-anti-sigma factor n=1 Tax=Actinoplanes sp. TBRC 11911 TaxID=2729386 RepID=UPI0020071628|nr:anti-anti-sigma factor [Actinoplanes sp. TBRC 11911]
MSSEVHHLVDHGLAYPLVRFSGVLDATTAAPVRSILLDLLAGQPEALVVDVAGLEPVAPAAVAMLSDLRRETADWPAAHLCLCCPKDAAGWRATGWPVWPEPGDAFAELGEPDRRTRLSAELEPQVGAARMARDLITEACARWDRPDLVGPACIVVTEMVNNVVAHARTPMTVLLAAHDDGMSVAVRDNSAVLPSYDGGPVAPTAFGGRGMLLIDSVASRWGSLVLLDGKVVWALLQADHEPEPPHSDSHDAAGMPDPARG